MQSIAQQLEALQQRIAAFNEPDWPVSLCQWLTILPANGLFHLDFYGNPFEEAYLDMLHTLAQPDIAPTIRSLNLRGPDEGANGTRHWELEPLVATQATFSHLEMFSIQLNQPNDHNQAIIGADYEEKGVLAKLLTKSPNLCELTVPSAPNAAFFEVGSHPLRFLNVDAGYDTQDFILHLAHSSCFPELASLEWGEYNQTYMKDYLDYCTPREHYDTLFQSQAFRKVRDFVWRNPIWTDEEIQALSRLRPDLSLSVVRYSARYISVK